MKRMRKTVVSVWLSAAAAAVVIVSGCKQQDPRPYVPAEVSGKWVLQTPGGKKYLALGGGAYTLEAAPDVYAPGKKYLIESGSYFTVVDSLHLSGSRYLYDVNRQLLDSLAIKYAYKYTVRGDTMFIVPAMEGQGYLVKTGGGR
jgi:hypothetical protein